MFRTTTISLFSILFAIPAFAQVSADGTTNTRVNVNGNDFTIQQGNRAGNNLFHSFGEFSVPTDGSAFFNNAADIVNIFSRVTGGNISNIDGLIGANGAANLFLINPAGIIFGEGARLDISGSFLGSTADSIVFPDGEFSATNLANPPLLTINAPIGLNFRDNPGDIVNQSVAQNDAGDVVGLEVASGKNLTLVGGRVVNEGGAMIAPDSNIFLGGLATAGTVALDDALNPSFPENSLRADVLINNGASLNVRAEGRGTINLIGNNITISDAQIRTGVDVGLGSQEIQPGVFNIDATNSVSINNGGVISTATLGPGNGGDIIINAVNNLNIDASGIATNAVKLDPNIVVGEAGNINLVSSLVEINNESTLSTVTNGEGNAGEVNIRANSLTLDDGSVILNSTLGTGNGGNINVEVDSLFLVDGGELSTTTEGEGNAGNINVNASDFITLSGTAPVKAIAGFPGGFSSGFFASSDVPATGQGGTVTVTTDRLQISDGAVVGARSKASGSGGNIIVNANSLEITGGGQILTAAFAEGNAGNITLNISEEINISGSDPTFFNRTEQVIELFNQLDLELPDPEQTIDPISPVSGIFANTISNSTGNAGSIDINANSIDLTGGSISAATNAGNQNQGSITLNIAENLTLRDNSLISARALSDADGGNVNINSQFIIAFPSQSPGNGNDIVADAVKGSGGNINITAESLLGIQEREALPNNGTNDIDASSDFGLDGNVSITTPDIHTLQTDINLPNNPIESEQAVAQACRSTSLGDQTTSLTIKGKGGFPVEPTEPLYSEMILVEEEITTSNLQAQYPEIKPIKTSIGDIYPARGIIKTGEGKIILTAYPTDNIDTRTPHVSANCNHS